MRSPGLYLVPFAVAAALTGCKTPDSAGAASRLRGADTPAGGALLSTEPTRVLYQVYVRGFYDGSLAPDGAGDFAGLAAKIPYLKDLGVDALLLMPVIQSTGGMGYIPRAYDTPDQEYGSKDDFKAFAAAAKAAGIRIMLDMPFNHISDDSPWFQSASLKACDPASPGYAANKPETQYCNFFFFTPSPCTTKPYQDWHKPWSWDSTDCNAVWFEKWGYDPTRDRPGKYYATFSQNMPDLKYWDFDQNAWNEPVVQAVQSALNQWVALGVDSFRLDAAKHLVEGYANNSAATPEPHNIALMNRLLTNARAVNPDVSFAGEIWADYGTIEPYIGPAMDIAFDFPFMSAVRDSVGGGDAGELRGVLQHFEATQEQIKPGQRIVFATNHDMPRLMTEWRDDEAKVRMAQFLTLMTPYTPLLFYGEELGMHGEVKRPDQTSPEEYVHTVYAFPWAGDAASGFPGGKVPTVGMADNAAEHNLAAAKAAPGSLWHFIKDVIALRRSFPLSNATRIYVDSSQGGSVLAYTLVSPDEHGGFHCRSVLANLSAQATADVTARHAKPECAAASVAQRYADGATPQKDAHYTLAPHGKLVVGD